VCIQDKQQKEKADDFCITGTGILKKKQELNELKAQLETAKRNVQEAEEEKTSHTQKYKDLKSNLQSLKKTFFSAEKETVKV
jgi:predicted  nucleic acid-binding Zn-ribbon protein